MKIAKIPYFFHDKPLFGLDIGPSSLKVMQTHLPGSTDKNLKLKNKKQLPQILGYGFTKFDRSAISDGVIVQPEIIAQAAKNLFSNDLIGDITTRRVALAIPAYRTFTRSLQLPKLKESDIASAVSLEAEQYISTPLNELYLDYDIIQEKDDKTDIFVVAVPKAIVDSYLELATIIGLETIMIEPTLSSSGRLYSLDPQSKLATVIIDFGSRSADISIYNQHILATGTVTAGGEIFTNAIKDKLNVSLTEAGVIKTKYGLGVSKKQTEIQAALNPILSQLVKEIRRMIRYYEERYSVNGPLTQIVTIGGGANMPGLSDYLTNALRLAVRHTDLWPYFNFQGLQPPNTADRSMYATVAGLSLMQPKAVFKK